MAKNKNEIHDTYKFLKLFREDDEEVVIAFVHENASVVNRLPKIVTHVTVKVKDLAAPLSKWVLKYKDTYGKEKQLYASTQNRRDGKGVFLIVNPGGTKNEEITGIRSYFADVDMAKEKYEFATEGEAAAKLALLQKSGNYETLEIEGKAKKYVLRALLNQAEIKKAKEAFLNRHDRALKDATIDETYAGYHLYWRVSDGSLERFSKIQHMLAAKFGGDVQVSNLSRMMRLPGFLHQKYARHVDVKVIQWGERVFTEAELIEDLQLQEIKQTKGHNKKEVQERVSFGSDLTRSVNVKVKESKESDLVFKAPVTSTKEMTFNDCLQEVLLRPLSDFIESPSLKIGKAVCCPFHNDKTPSASVFTSSEGKELFHCHACDVGTKDIIGMYKRTTGKDFAESVRDLAQLLGIDVIETKFEKQQFQKYRHNRLYIERGSDELFPFTNHYIGTRKPYLRFFNDKGEVMVGREDFQYKNENVFFISFRAAMKEMNKKSMDTVQNAIYLLNVLGFIERVPENAIPDALRERAERERKVLQEELRGQGEKGAKRAEAVRLINFYIVPSWNDRADAIEVMAKLMKEGKFTFKSTMNKTGLTKMFGKEVAHRVYPDERVVSNRFQAVEDKLMELIKQSLGSNGFCVLESLMSALVRVTIDGKRIKVNAGEKQDVLKRAMPSILAALGDEYEVKKVRSKAKQEQLFGMSSDSEIIAIVKKTVL